MRERERENKLRVTQILVPCNLGLDASMIIDLVILYYIKTFLMLIDSSTRYHICQDRLQASDSQFYSYYMKCRFGDYRRN